MGNVKPFLFGTIAGAGIAFVALQYHLVQSSEGFRIVPRSPQHSLGLAYADVRNWDTEQWADRPELAKALVAHGSTDLISQSLIGDVVESVSAESSTLNELTDFLNQPASTEDADSLFDSSSFLSLPGQTESSEDRQSDDLFSAPFPRDTRGRSTDSAATGRRNGDATIARRNKPVIDDVFGAGSNGLPSLSPFGDRPQDLPTARTQPAPQTGTDVAQETKLLKSMLFGDAAESDTLDSAAASGGGLFEDVTEPVMRQSRQQPADIWSSGRAKAEDAYRDSVNSVKRFVREKAGAALSGSAPVFSEDLGAPSTSLESVTSPDSSLPPALKAIRDGFDPFVE